jgi:flagellar protein FlaG
MNTINNPQRSNFTNVDTTTSAPTRKAEEKPTTPLLKASELLPSRQEEAVNGKTLPVSARSQDLNEQNLDKAIAKINKYVQQIQRDLQFSVDDESGKTVIKVIDSESKEIIRQIPEEIILQVAQSIEESHEGTLLEVKA